MESEIIEHVRCSAWCRGDVKVIETDNGQQREVRVPKAMMLLTVQEWVTAKAGVYDILRLGLACCLNSISGGFSGVPVAVRICHLGLYEAYFHRTSN